MSARQDFEKHFGAWKATWFSTLSSSTTAWAHGPDWDALVAMGEAALPLLIEKLEDSKGNFPAMCLYDALTAASGPATAAAGGRLQAVALEGEQGRARRAVQQYRAAEARKGAANRP
eukprot:m51a1_g10291 hypothetical protein (117) ;mRNA; r:37499-37849